MMAATIAMASSLITGIFVAIVTFLLTRRREREAEWRKLKLDRYQEFFLALSGIASSGATLESRRRLADAENCLSLVAPIDVLRALKAFHYEVSPKNLDFSLDSQNVRLSDLFRTMRADVNPTKVCDDPAFVFEFRGPQASEELREPV
jgi:hypothetical protein